MKKIVRLTESDLTRIVRRVIKEDTESINIVTMEDKDIKSLRLLDDEGRNILKNYKLGTEGGLNQILLYLKKVNFGKNEKLQLRFWISDKIYVKPEQMQPRTIITTGEFERIDITTDVFQKGSRVTEGQVVVVNIPLSMKVRQAGTIFSDAGKLQNLEGEIKCSNLKGLRFVYKIKFDNDSSIG